MNDTELREKIKYITKSHACTQVYFDKDSMEDYPKMIDKIMEAVANHSASVEREARIDELNGLQGCPPILVDATIKDRIKELTPPKANRKE